MDMFVLTEFVSGTLGSFSVLLEDICTITNSLASSTEFLTGVNFINAPRAAFDFEDPKSAKRSDNLIFFFCFQDLRV